MTAPNRNVLWARVLADELAAGGVRSVVVTPGSQSTPLMAAFARHPDVRVYSQVDERSTAYFALGRARRTGRVTPLVCPAGTATANYAPAVIEADQGRVPLLALTADRPPALRDSGANRTIDQEKLYGDSVRWYRDLPEPEADPQTLRALRTTAARALGEATGVPSGPVHLNVPFRTPVESVEFEEGVPEGPTDMADSNTNPVPTDAARAFDGRDGAYVETTQGVPELDDRELAKLGDALSVDRGLIVAGPADAPGLDSEAIAALAHASGFPIVADPLSGLRFGSHVRTTTVLGGYDTYLTESVTAKWPDPEVVVRLGASPTSKSLRNYLARAETRQLVVDPAGGWRDAEFTATDLVTAEPSRLARRLARTVQGRPDSDWQERWERAEQAQWAVLEEADTDEHFQGRVLATVADLAPEPATLFVSDSVPVRELNRFARPQPKGYTVLGNRGTGGIDGITSTALGAGSAADEHLTLVTGKPAYYRDMNGLLALDRFDVEATIVLLDTEGGEGLDRASTESIDDAAPEQIKTPLDLDVSATEELYDLDFERVDLGGFRDAYADAVATAGASVLEVRTDADRSSRARERLRDRVVDRIEERR